LSTSDKKQDIIPLCLHKAFSGLSSMSMLVRVLSTLAVLPTFGLSGPMAEDCSANNSQEGSGICLAPQTSRRLGPIEAALMQHSFVHSKILEPSVEALEYDCNGDGIQDCGLWDYNMGMCANLAECGHRYKFPDLSLDQSCRCRKCSGHQDTAFADPLLQAPESGARFEAVYWGRFKNWHDHVDTCAHWVMPKNDAALRELLEYARAKGYKVRIGGAGHSAAGLVTDGQDDRVLVLSLGEYIAPGEWEFGLRDMPDGSKRATANAGWTQANLYAKIRPLGYFVPAQTAGYFFSLGGLVANSVHGGSYLSGFIHSYATRLRVMTYDGAIRIIESEDEMRFWRNSFGLLGIILGVELQLERRDQLQMYVVEKNMESWSADQFWRLIKQDSEADLPLDVVPDGGSAGTRRSWNGEYFIDFVNGGEAPTAVVYAQKANHSVDPDFAGQSGIPRDVDAQYRQMMEKRVRDGWHGEMSWDEAARRDGAPPIKIAGVDVNDLLKAFKRLPLARTMSRKAVRAIEPLVEDMSDKVNDGFFLAHAPAALAAAYFVEPSQAFEAMDYLRRVQLESLSSNEFVWNLPGEFRFVNVQDSAVLQPVPAGLWFNCQMIAFADLAKNDQAWKREFKRVEDYWVKHLKAKPHMGKLFGFEEVSADNIQPFADSYSCSIYTSEQKRTFSAYRQKVDPEGLFATGQAMKFLVPCTP